MIISEVLEGIIGIILSILGSGLPLGHIYVTNILVFYNRLHGVFIEILAKVGIKIISIFWHM